ncbi:MAG: Sas10/Utp3/C1D family protein, partial [Kiritimatiellia bacterium]
MITRKAFSRASGAVLAAVGTLLLLHSLWQLAAGWALRAELKAEAQAGLPGSLQDLTPPAVKPEDNAAVLLQTAFALMQKDRGVSPESHPLVKEIIQCRLDVGPDREGRD